MSTFDGFSEEDIQKLKTTQNSSFLEKSLHPKNVKKISQIGFEPSRSPQNTHPIISDDQKESIDISVEKCKLSIKTPTEISEKLKQINVVNVEKRNKQEENKIIVSEDKTNENANVRINEITTENLFEKLASTIMSDTSGDKDYGELAEKVQTAKLEELQLKQKLMEEQNRKRREMLAKALADRAKQTEAEALRLEKIKKELALLDGQLSQDVAVMRKQIDMASLIYAEAEKNYLRVEKDFLQAKLTLQKEKEKKELLSEHLCALIMHNETRKAQKLVTLMEQLQHFGENSNTNSTRNTDEENDSSANDLMPKNFKNKGKDDKNKGKSDKSGGKKSKNAGKSGFSADKNGNTIEDSIEPIVVDGVDERTGKMVEVDLS